MKNPDNNDAYSYLKDTNSEMKEYYKLKDKLDLTFKERKLLERVFLNAGANIQPESRE